MCVCVCVYVGGSVIVWIPLKNINTMISCHASVGVYVQGNLHICHQTISPSTLASQCREDIAANADEGVQVVRHQPWTGTDTTVTTDTTSKTATETSMWKKDWWIQMSRASETSITPVSPEPEPCLSDSTICVGLHEQTMDRSQKIPQANYSFRV